MSIRVDQVSRCGATRTWVCLLPGYLLYCGLSLLNYPFTLLRERRRRKKGLIGAGEAVRKQGGTPIPPHCTVIEGNGLGETRVGLVAYDQIVPQSGKVALLVQKDPAVALGQATGKLVGYAPAHNPIAVLRFLKRAKPKEILFIETCSNYHLAFLARVRGIPTMLVSANISEFLARRMRRSVLGAWKVNLACRVVTQAPSYTMRLRQSGVWPEILSTGGLSISSEIPSQAQMETLAAKWRSILQLTPDQPVIVAGSTYEEEHRLLLEAFCQLDHELNAILVIAPRHQAQDVAPSRIAVRRSELPAVQRGDRRVIILDSTGELSELYSLAAVAHIGGTRDPRLGGHTPIEALMAGIPFTTGPEYGRHEPVTLAALEAGSGWLTNTPQEMALHWQTAISQPETKARARQTYAALVEKNRDVFARSYRELGALRR